MDGNQLDNTTIHVRRAVNGDTESLDWLYRHLSPLLETQARYRMPISLRSHVEARDVVQDVWSIVLPKIGNLNARDGRFTPVLIRFLSSVLLRHLSNLSRKQGRSPRVVETPGIGEARDPIEGAEGPGLVTTALGRERARLLRETIAAMPEDLREILVLRGIEQHAYDEIAEALEIEPGTARGRYFRALERLRRELPKEIVEDISDADAPGPDR